MVLKKTSFFIIISIYLLLFVAGCNNTDTMQNNIITMKNINGVAMFPVEDISKVSSIKVSLDKEQIILQEDQLQITLLLGSNFIYRHKLIVDSLSVAPLKMDNTIFLPSSFIDDYLTSDKEEGLSLYHGAKYLPSEIASAFKDPNNEHHRKILNAIELPRSMHISIPKIDENRIIQTQPLSSLPAVLIEDLKRQGYEDAGNYTYGEYQAISELQTLEEAGLTSLKRSYPELSQVDISNWTVKDYHQWQREYVQKHQNSSYSDEEKRIMQEKGILIEDMFYLHKEFFGSVFEQPDQVLKECLEAYYKIPVDRILER